MNQNKNHTAVYMSFLNMRLTDAAGAVVTFFVILAPDTKLLIYLLTY